MSVATNCFMFQAAPNLVTPEQRHQAEQVFLSFHQTTGPYVICKKILGIHFCLLYQSEKPVIF